jgi:hypothetical protein
MIMTAAATSGHIFASSARDRPWSAVVCKSSDPWNTKSSSNGREVKSASTSPTNPTNVLKSAFIHLKGPVSAVSTANTFCREHGLTQPKLTPSEGGRGRSRVLHPGTVRHRRTMSPSVKELRNHISRPVTIPSQLNRLLESLDESSEMSSLPRREPLHIRKRSHSSNRFVRRIQETERPVGRTTESVPQEDEMTNERGRSVSEAKIVRSSRPHHKPGFSEERAMRRSASFNGKRAPSPLRHVLNQAESREVDGLQIPTGIPEVDSEDIKSPRILTGSMLQTPNHEQLFDSHIDCRLTGLHHSRNSSVNTNKELPEPEFLMPGPLFSQPDADGMQAVLGNLGVQYGQENTYSSEFDIHLPESPSSDYEQHGSEAQSPTFSSIKGGISGVSTPQRLSEVPEWTLQSDKLGVDFDRSMENLSLHARSESTTSTAMYSLPEGCDGNPFATEKSQEAEPEVRQLSQMEQLLDEFEYLGAALI